MASLNQVSLIGNLTRDPEVRYTPKGTAVAKVGLAINRTWKSEGGEKKEEVTFIDIDVFGKTAENLAQYCRKGKSIFVGGRLHLSEWEDKTTHQKRTKLTVVADQIQFLGERPESASPPQSKPQGRPSPMPEKEGDSEAPF